LEVEATVTELNADGKLTGSAGPAGASAVVDTTKSAAGYEPWAGLVTSDTTTLTWVEAPTGDGSVTVAVLVVPVLLAPVETVTAPALAPSTV